MKENTRLLREIRQKQEHEQEMEQEEIQDESLLLQSAEDFSQELRRSEEDIDAEMQSRCNQINQLYHLCCVCILYQRSRAGKDGPP